MLRVGIGGGSGYSGVELIQILLRHPEVEITFLSSERYAGDPVEVLFPHLRSLIDVRFSKLEDVAQTDLDVLFLALPHGEAMRLVPQLDNIPLIIDLSGDFRIPAPEVFEQYYGFAHTAMEQQKGFIYGLTEINRDQLRGARRISNPGCFATATILALYPLYRKAWVDGPVYVDSKTGSSGAGRSPSATTHHPRRTQSLFPYKPFSHQHIPEIEQLLDRAENRLIFQPHSAPFVRGIFASHYMQLIEPKTAEEVRALYQEIYAQSPFIRIVPGCPDLSCIQHSNFVDIGVATDDRHLIVWSTLDNLQKGAAGQAVQNMNVACGFEETLGLTASPAFP